MNNPEDIVQIALSAYDKSRREWAASRSREDFELELRRLLMQTESQVQLKPVGPLKRDGEPSATIRAAPSHTYTVNPPNLMGTWTTGGTQTHTRNCPPTITGPNKEILNG
jgi:hypothetical protein